MPSEIKGSNAMEKEIRILHLEDDPLDTELIYATLESASIPCKITRVQSSGEFSDALRTGGYDLILSDYRLPSYDGISALSFVREQYANIPFIFVSGTMGEDAAIQALTEGATDYVLKQKLSRLAPAVTRALRDAENRAERRRAEEALKRSESEYRHLFDNANDVILIFEPKQEIILEANAAACAIYGFDYDELIGMSLKKLTKDVARGEAVISSTLESGSSHDFESVHINKRGEQINFLINSSVVEYRDKKAILSINRDITERKRAEEEIRQRLSELQGLYETSNALSVEHDLNTLLQSIVENARKLLNSAAGGMYLSIPGGDELELVMHTAPYIPLGTHVSLGERVVGRVAQTRQPIRVDDYSTWEGRSPLYEGTSIRALLEVPMLYRGELIGVLIAEEDGESERKYTEEDEHLLSLFASQAAGAIHSARLFEETRRRAEEFAGLYQTTRDLSIQQDLSTVLTIITRQATALLNVPNASITLYDPVRADLELVASIGPDLPIGTRRKIGDGLAGRVAQTHAPIIIEDYQNWEHRSPLYAAIPYTAMMGVPLLYSGNLLGVLDVSDVTPSTRTFSEADVRLLSLFAGQAASAIANARLFEETVRRLENLQSLRTIDDAISGSADVNLILEVILSQVISQLGADAAVILLFDPAEQILEYAAGRGFRTQALQHTRLTLGEGYAGRVAQERKTKHIPDIRAYNTDFLRSPTLSQEGFISYYGVPLITKGDVKGVLEVFHRTPFEAENDWLSFLEMLSGQTAIAIDNTALYKGLQLSNIELTLAYDATIEGWSRALDLRDKETEGHTQRVTEITINLAKAMSISEVELVNIRRGALLHDIGKMGVPDSILLKSGELTNEEWEIMRRHPIYAYEMLTPIAYLKTALDIPYCHHEKWDGSGYPNGLKGKEIPLAARIFAVVDVWDAVTSNRPYRSAWTKEKALDYIKEQAGKNFDPQVVEAFLRLITDK